MIRSKKKVFFQKKDIFFIMEADGTISCLDRLLDVHAKLILSAPTAECMFELCADLSTDQGRSSKRFMNALQTCDVQEFDKPWPEDDGMINIGQCCSFAPHDTSDVDRMAQKLTLFPVTGEGNFMQRLRILMEKARSAPQLSYAHLISNFPFAVYLILFQKIAKDEACTIVEFARKGSPSCQKVLTVPGLIAWNDWYAITREWNRQTVNGIRTGDDTDILTRLVGNGIDRHDVRSFFGNDHLHSFLAEKLGILMKRRHIGPRWLSFSGDGQCCSDKPLISPSGISSWQYGHLNSFHAEEATLKFRIVLGLVSGNPRKAVSLPPKFPLSQLKALVEQELRDHNVAPCTFSLNVGFPSSKIDAEDDVPIDSLGIAQEVITVRNM